MTAVARQNATQQVHFIRVPVQWNSSGIASGVPIGAVPAGAQIVDVTVRIVTAFNAATTNVLQVGTTATGGEVLTSAEAAAGSTGFKRGTTGGTVSFASDTILYASYTQTGTAASAGSAIICIMYVPNTDITALP